MEINHYGDTVMGAVAMEALVEGRMVLLAAHTFSTDFGSQTDLPGARLPDSVAEAAKARYIVKFAQDNRSLPIYQPQPAFAFALRYGFDQGENAPFAATVYITHPGVQLGRTIPSGANLVLYGEGIYTLASGEYVGAAALQIPGATMTVCNGWDDGANSGKLKSSATNIVAEVIRYNAANDDLTVKILTD